MILENPLISIFWTTWITSIIYLRRLTSDVLTEAFSGKRHSVVESLDY